MYDYMTKVTTTERQSMLYVDEKHEIIIDYNINCYFIYNTIVIRCDDI